MYAPLDCSVYGDSRYLGIFSRDEVKGKLQFKEDTYAKELIHGTVYDKRSEFDLVMSAKDARFFVFEEGSLK